MQSGIQLPGTMTVERISWRIRAPAHQAGTQGKMAPQGENYNHNQKTEVKSQLERLAQLCYVREEDVIQQTHTRHRGTWAVMSTLCLVLAGWNAWSPALVGSILLTGCRRQNTPTLCQSRARKGRG